MTFPPLNDATLQAANCVGKWLARDDLQGAAPDPCAELVVLAGNAVIPTIDAACRLAAEDRLLLISGGIGHSTAFLYDAVAAHPRYCGLDTAGRTEAAILADIAHHFWQIPRERILVEDRSTNCGENVRFTLALLAARGLAPQTGIVLQDPTMQRRTMATLARAQQDSGAKTRWLSYPGYLPVLHNAGGSTAFACRQEGVWTVDRYLALVLGELPRLRDDENGYGPRGRDFIAHVAFPQDVVAAWRVLLQDVQLRALLHARAPA